MKVGYSFQSLRVNLISDIAWFLFCFHNQIRLDGLKRIFDSFASATELVAEFWSLPALVRTGQVWAGSEGCQLYVSIDSLVFWVHSDTALQSQANRFTVTLSEFSTTSFTIASVIADPYFS